MKNGIHIMPRGRRTYLTIPEIGLKLQYSGLGIPYTIISVPMSTMYNKTVGLCGKVSFCVFAAYAWVWEW